MNPHLQASHAQFRPPRPARRFLSIAPNSAAGTLLVLLAIAAGVIRPSTAAAQACATVGLPTGSTFTNTIGMQFVRIQPGTFTMGVGSTPLPAELQEGRPELANGDFDEGPNHLVTISQPFYMGIYEVTNAQYEQF